MLDGLVNKIRKYHPRALASGDIFEDDHEFGEIHPTPNLSRSTSERVLHETDLNHLKETERQQVLAILLKHRTLFTSDVKIAKVGAHRIRLKPNIERKKPFLYRILESLKIKFDEQIEELLRLDLIEESDAEIAYPIVCVNKKDGNSNDEFEKITLSSAFGENVEAELIKTSITLDNDSLNHPMDCLVAITDKLNAEALIPPSFYEALCSINNETNENDIFTESVDSFTPFSNDENDAESVNEIFYVESDSDNLNLNSDYSKMKDEQNNCDSLKMVRAELKLNKGNFLLVEELIYHRDKILNEPVMQLVLPRCRIEKVMKLAHELLYGREARGPLAILKSSWAGEIHLPTNISQSAADYLQEMKIKMEKAAESASLTAAQKQKSYGDYFNKRSSVKNFSIGEQVVLLIPDSSNKIYARWTGPGEIIQHHPPHSYKVKLPDGTIRHVHVNKIRNYHPRTLASGVIFDDDHEFGEIHPTPNLSRSTSERVLHETDLNHLKETEREQVLAILLKHRTLFTSDVKIAKVGAHRIRLKPNIERKKPFLYRILESLKIKVDEQIEELLRLDLIEESDAEIAYPIVCVNKKDVSPPLTRRRTVSPYRKNVLFVFEIDSFSAPVR
ncbi:retrovirus-related Pol polyprotein from transposon 17.6 [Trichonephila clavata]|uniref:Retrovirus-related Pol polyprotein from transposon 17.6 n=1 Tax=Trichonephila clavata TaxID=2740835 RepID=A0A8X6GD37_TRICU|nr:retrovirus-related Pol polyprotein from transposon 17.6 [Trichonephila clavata]